MSNPNPILIFADGADKASILKRYKEGFVKGFTTNPTLMAKAGIRDYEAFAKEVLNEVKDLPISFEVFSDDFPEMERQALKIASWGSNVYVKIPITNTKKDPSLGLIKNLLSKGVKLNITAIFTKEQLLGVKEVLAPKDQVVLSIFAGRIADTSIDPTPICQWAVNEFKAYPNTQILWASPREVLNIAQAEACGCHIITATDDLIEKYRKFKNKSLSDFSVETVQMFYNDAKSASFKL